MIVAALPITTEPEVRLRGGRIYEVKSELWPEVTYHFVGYSEAGGGRCSSAIQEFDMEKKLGVTQSGRVYQLTDGRTGFSDFRDAEYVWSIWKQHNEIISCVDVTDQFITKSDEDEDE